MVLETLLPSNVARERPHYMMLIAFLFAIVGMWLAYYVFPNSASILTLAFIVIAAEPVIRKTLMDEEDEEAKKPGSAATFLGRHFDLIKMYSWFFLGLVLAYMTWYIILPSGANGGCLAGEYCGNFPTQESVFAEQERQLQGIGHLRSELSGNVVATTGNVAQLPRPGDFWGVAGFLFQNNATVLLLAVFFSFLFGEGALFLIGWNASIIGTVMGKISSGVILTSTTNDIWTLFHALGYGIYQGIGFIPHGIPEIGAYYIGAIAGGIISASIAKEAYKSHEFRTIAKDAAALIITAILLLVVAALIESWLWIGF
ncbi:MAG: stage II sporulation protein M [Candidatus Diapherotrites archaeon]|nr:stage II sporulation protein M [Candidatus Diapherotrites archaeon]MDZ4256481.1 stage II sporulation protein M [archaeon]